MNTQKLFLLIGAAAVAVAFSAKKAYGNTLEVDFPQGVRERTKPVQGIVVHWTNTNSPEATVRILKKRGFATAFEVDQKGNVFQYVNPEIFYTDSTGGGSNEHTIAIDVTHVPGEPWSSEQLNSTFELIHKLAKDFGFPIKVAPDGIRKDWKDWKETGFTVFRHRNFKPTECPGDFPLEMAEA